MIKTEAAHTNVSTIDGRIDKDTKSRLAQWVTHQVLVPVALRYVDNLSKLLNSGSRGRVYDPNICHKSGARGKTIAIAFKKQTIALFLQQIIQAADLNECLINGEDSNDALVLGSIALLGLPPTYFCLRKTF